MKREREKVEWNIERKRVGTERGGIGGERRWDEREREDWKREKV